MQANELILLTTTSIREQGLAPTAARYRFFHMETAPAGEQARDRAGLAARPLKGLAPDQVRRPRQPVR